MGKAFGEYSFFSDKPREISIKSDQVTHVAFISRKDFLGLLANFEEDFVNSSNFVINYKILLKLQEKFSIMKEKVNLYGDKSILEKPCVSCDRLDHFISECPIVNAHFNNATIISNYKTDCYNQRNNGFLRKQRKSYNSLKFIKDIQNKTKAFENFITNSRNFSSGMLHSTSHHLFISYIKY